MPGAALRKHIQCCRLGEIACGGEDDSVGAALQLKNIEGQLIERSIQVREPVPAPRRERVQCPAKGLLPSTGMRERTFLPSEDVIRKNGSDGYEKEESRGSQSGPF